MPQVHPEGEGPEPATEAAVDDDADDLTADTPEPEPATEPELTADEIETDTSVIRMRAFNFLESMPVQITSLLMTLFALFMFDVNAALLHPSADFTIQLIMTIAFAFFVFELILTAVSRKRFYGDLFFWLDIIATLSIIPDVPWLMDGVMIMLGQEPSDTTPDAVRAGGRVARVGARAARMVRVMRLLRLLRIFKLLRFLKKDTATPAEKVEDKEAGKALKDVVPMNLATDISATVSRRVVLILLFVLIAANVFASETYDASPDLAIQMLKSSNSNLDDEDAKNMLLAAKPNLIFLGKNGQELYASDGTGFAVSKDEVDTELRQTELDIILYEASDANSVNVEMWLDVSDDVRGEAVGTLLLLIALVVILLSSNYVLSNDAIKIVGEPLDRVSRAQQATRAIMSAFKKISREGIEFDEVKNVMVATGHKVLDAEVVNLFLLDNVQDELWATHTPDDSSPYEADLRIARGVGLVGKVCDTQKTINVTYTDPGNIPDDDLSLSSGNAEFQPRDVVCVGIIKGDVCVGVLQVINKIHTSDQGKKQKKLTLKRKKMDSRAGFSRVDEMMLEAFAAQIAPIIARRSTEVSRENAMSKDSVKSSATGSLLAAFASAQDTEYHSGRSRERTSFQGKAKLVTHMVHHHAQDLIDQGMIAAPHTNLPKLSQLSEWGHSCLHYTHEQLVGCSMMMLLEVGCTSIGIEHLKATAYISEVLMRYSRVPYHNMYHAFNVMQGCFSVLTTSELAKKFSVQEKVVVLIAALGHDAGHDGVNTAFHVAMESELTTHYNDRSPLENMHAWHTFDTMRAHNGNCDLLSDLTAKQRKTIRHQIINTIIATDMAFHNKKVDEFSGKEKIDMGLQTDRDLLMEVIVHTVDLGHSTYSWLEECRWARLVATEFQAQVDRERAAGVPPTVFMECTGEAHLGKGQLGFIDYVVKPIYAAVAERMPEMKVALDNATTNRQNWKEVSEGTRPMLGNDNGEDDDLIAWSVNVGSLAAGPSSVVMKEAMPVTVLMSEPNKLTANSWNQKAVGNERYVNAATLAPHPPATSSGLPPLPGAMSKDKPQP